MTRTSRLAICAILCLALPSRVGAQTLPTADSVYARLVARLERGDTLVDYQALRLAFAGRTAYEPISSARAALRQRLRAAFAGQDPAVIVAEADSVLALNYADIFAHVALAGAAYARHDEPQARFHGAIARGLLRSLDAARRGASTGAPILIVTPEEEEDFGMATHLQRTDRYRTAQCGTRVCDSVVFHTESGRDTTVHFDMTLIANKVLH